ncbi:fluoride efflux transporter FluC [Bhargavaea cecembensis]|uniref:fluoride efflux transporter FluC n=1 Tax=Bhargavaea cecembensis TaxID=394098 RepID=UPI00058BD8DF|nr:CrcB family protein [Bhargavaea cecembensis]
MKDWIAVGLGGALGAVLRFLIGSRLQSDGGFPFGTLAVNLGGAFILCALIGAAPLSGAWKAAVHTGFLGSFTTFSALGTELFLMLESGKWGMAAVYAGVSLAGGLAAGLAGYRFGEGRSAR